MSKEPDANLVKAAPDLLAALEACLRLIEAEIPFPEIDHICGSPDACCDGDCMDAAYLSKVRSDASFAIRKAKGLAPYG